MNTRTREHGTIESLPNAGEERIEIVRRIVSNQQYEKIDGIMLDLFSASAILTVYDRLSEANQAKYRVLPVRRMAEIALELIKRA